MRFLIFIFLIILSTSFKQADYGYINYPKELGIAETCIGQEVVVFILIEAFRSNKKSYKVHSFNLDKIDCKIYYGNRVLSKADTLDLIEGKPIMLKLKYIIVDSQKFSLFTFKTNHQEYLHNQIKLNYGQYDISSEDIGTHREQVIKITESCQDTMKIAFPYRDVTLYKSLKNKNKNKIYKLVIDEFGEEGSSLKITTADKGQYIVVVGLCHDVFEFWLKVK